MEPPSSGIVVLGSASPKPTRPQTGRQVGKTEAAIVRKLDTEGATTHPGCTGSAHAGRASGIHVPIGIGGYGRRKRDRTNPRSLDLPRLGFLGARARPRRDQVTVLCAPTVPGLLGPLGRNAGRAKDVDAVLRGNGT